MKAVIQRVTRAAVSVGGEVVGGIEQGLFVLLGVAEGDTQHDAEKLAAKTAKLRIFCDESGKLSKSASDIGGGILTVSNFTLCGNCSHGNRPDFTAAAKAQKARELYLHFIDIIEQSGVKKSASGRFGADMKISAELDGPVTIVIDTETM
ncbi:MAG TPA: D-aminoacyl-tRNA deacylase [Ruminiclostridium sp.]|nr:D-aminoacyl-tRNA deacylase [Ruminiclostridium sp.]